MIEILLAVWGNVQATVGVTMVISAIAAAICLVASGIMQSNGDKDDAASLRVWRTRFFVAALALAPIACIPSLDDIWKVRIALLKCRLASPENVQKGADEISRIAHKLECRYLGCNDTKDKEAQK